MTCLTRCFSASELYLSLLRTNNISYCISRSQKHSAVFKNKSMHCYRTLHPWDNFEEFCKYIISSIEHNKDDLLVLNKPYGIKIHGHDKPGARPKSAHQFIKSSVPECDFTIEDTLPVLQEHFKLPNLSIIKSTEKYSSGIVLLSASDAVTEKLKKSFNLAKLQKKPHLIFWAVTVGHPFVPYRKEKVGIKFVEAGKDKIRQPIIETDISKRSIKFKKVHPVLVESRTISINENPSASLIEIATSSVNWHFVKVYASARMAPVLGDTIYGSRMKKLLNIPVKAPLSVSSESGFEHLPEKFLDILELPKGTSGQLMIPTMLHLKSVLLPDFYQKKQDYTVTVNLSPHLDWTVNKLNLLYRCK